MAENYKKPTTSIFFISPKLITNFSFTSKAVSEKGSESVMIMSPTSILDSRLFTLCSFKNPFWSPKTSIDEHKRCFWDSKGLVEALMEESPKSQNRLILFASQLKIQISTPQYETLIPSESAKHPRVSTEMELSEDYTRVISHGPNPRTTHIFADCVLGTDYGSGSSAFAINNGFVRDCRIRYPCKSFLSFCCYCKKKLGPNVDIYMYSGEKAFCSRECRYKGMIHDGMSKKEAAEYL